MKSNVWFELPKALIELGKDILSSNDLEYIKLLTESSNDFSILYNEITTEVSQNAIKSMELSMSIDQLKEMKDKLHELNKERVELICKCIKSSIQIISKLMDYFECQSKFEKESIKNDTLVQLKIFSKIIRVIITNSENYGKKSQLQKEKSFFNMILVFTEKTQTKLYHVSTELINKFLMQQGKQPIIIDNSKQINEINHDKAC